MPTIESGQRYGRLVVQERYATDKHYNVTWLCLCDCGNTHVTQRQHLRSGRARSCGCLRHENRGERNPAWRGDEAGYSAIHKWISAHKTKTGVCVDCGESRRTQWSNVDHRYQRVLDEWVERCSPCHYVHDTMIIGSIG